MSRRLQVVSVTVNPDEGSVGTRLYEVTIRCQVSAASTTEAIMLALHAVEESEP